MRSSGFSLWVASCASFVSKFVWIFSPLLYSADMSPIWRLMTSSLSQIHSTSTREERGSARCPQYRSNMQVPPADEQIVLRESPTGWTQPKPTYIVFPSNTHMHAHRHTHIHTCNTQRNRPPGQQHSTDTWSCCLRLQKKVYTRFNSFSSSATWKDVFIRLDRARCLCKNANILVFSRYVCHLCVPVHQR